MIRINLAKKRPGTAAGTASAATEDSGSQELRKRALVNLFIIFIFPAGLAVFENYNIPEKRKMINEMKRKVQELQVVNSKAESARAELKKYNEDKDKIQMQIGILENLRVDRSKEVQVLDLIQRQIPEKVWLTSLDLREKTLRLSGAAINDSDISSFLENLSKSIFLKDVSLVKSNVDNIANIGPVKKFEITCAVERETN